MYTVYVMDLNQNTPVVGKILFWGLGWKEEGGGITSFQFSSRGAKENILSSSGRTNAFSTYVSNFRTPLPLVVINDTSLSTNDSKTKYSNGIHQ